MSAFVSAAGFYVRKHGAFLAHAVLVKRFLPAIPCQVVQLQPSTCSLRQNTCRARSRRENTTSFALHLVKNTRFCFVFDAKSSRKCSMHVTIEKQIKSLYQTATRAVAGVEATRNTYYTTETAEYIAAEFQNPDKYTPLHTVTTYCLHYQQASERGRKEGSKEGRRQQPRCFENSLEVLAKRSQKVEGAFEASRSQKSKISACQNFFYTAVAWNALDCSRKPWNPGFRM